MTDLQATATNVIYKWRDPAVYKVGAIELAQQLQMDTRWAVVLVTGVKSILKPGDHILLSARPVSYTFEYEGETMYNTSDESTLAFKRDGKLGATAQTILYEWLHEADAEETTESGIIIKRKKETKEFTPMWAVVHAAGPDAGVIAGDHILVAYNKDAYTIEIDGHKLHNCGSKESLICYRRPSASQSV
jgi:co-chaperonin GroES (HSP10)